MKGVLRILGLALFLSVISFGWHARHGRLESEGGAASIPRIPVTAAAREQSILWLDARPEADYDRGHIPGALPLRPGGWDAEFPAVIDRWQPGNKVVIYCRSDSCETSEAVARRLIEATKWPDVYVLEGGWEAWAAGSKH
jgi:rhodanese-related sulfurtransferase